MSFFFYKKELIDFFKNISFIKENFANYHLKFFYKRNFIACYKNILI